MDNIKEIWQIIINNMSIIIALIALLVSFSALYLSALSPANFNIKIGNSFGLNTVILDKSNLIPAISLPLTITNKGARHGDIYQMGLKLTYPSGENEYFKSIREIDSMSHLINQDQEKTQLNVVDVFFGISILGKSNSKKIIMFIPVEKDQYIFPDNFIKAKIELFAKKSVDKQWERYDETIIFIDNSFNYKKKDQRIRETIDATNGYNELKKL